MDREVTRTLLALNRQFYDTFARSFAETRGSYQPGLHSLLARVPLRSGHQVLDVGCGNGRLAHGLDRLGIDLHYTGVDASRGLLDEAYSSAATLSHVRCRFGQMDIAVPGWADSLPVSSYDLVAILAVLHHLPGRRLRRDVLAELRSCLKPGGLVALSTWQFLNSPRLRRKIVDWSELGLRRDQVETGDFLLDWQRDGVGLRYCHLVDETEVRELAKAAGLRVITTFEADGREGNLNLFALLQADS